MRLFAVLFVSLLAAACASAPASDNPFARHYVQKPPSGAQMQPLADGPHMYRGSAREADDARLRADGYELLGTSDFEGGDVPPDKALEQAKAVHADIVLVYSELAGKRLVATDQSAASKGHALKGKDGDGRDYGRLAPAEGDSYRYFASYWVKRAP